MGEKIFTIKRRIILIGSLIFFLISYFLFDKQGVKYTGIEIIAMQGKMSLLLSIAYLILSIASMALCVAFYKKRTINLWVILYAILAIVFLSIPVFLQLK